jgi:fatty acid desaturase
MAEYLDEAQRTRVKGYLAGATGFEWQTWLVTLAVYGSWLFAVVCRETLTLLPATLLLILACVWFMSLQHEFMHGHPTRHAWLNKALGYAPLAVWFPYTLYRETHMRHHRDENLTHPGLDPESSYIAAEVWRDSGAIRRALYRARKTFWGRVVLGPPMAIFGTLRGSASKILGGDLRELPMWLCHGALLVLMLYALQRWAGIPWWYYLLCVAYPALSLAMIRSYFEHRPAEDPKHRIVINEAGRFMRLLFLDNNYHLVHHDLPHLSWYLIARVYRDDRDAYLRRCNGFLLHGYLDLMRVYGFEPIDEPHHPLAGVSRPADMPVMPATSGKSAISAKSAKSAISGKSGKFGKFGTGGTGMAARSGATRLATR